MPSFCSQQRSGQGRLTGDRLRRLHGPPRLAAGSLNWGLGAGLGESTTTATGHINVRAWGMIRQRGELATPFLLGTQAGGAGLANTPATGDTSSDSQTLGCPFSPTTASGLRPWSAPFTQRIAGRVAICG